MTEVSQEKQYLKEVLTTYTYSTIWIGLSASVILYNKYILSSFGFPYPIALTMWHMSFCSIVAWIMIKANYVESMQMSQQMYLRCVVPIAACFSIVLILGNSAYIYLSVSFIQMLKATMPVTVYITGLFMGNEKYTNGTVANMCVITLGIAIASYGELHFVLIGVIMQMCSIISESVRLSLVQVLLQRQGIKLNPIQSLYYISPMCLMFLTPLFLLVEYPKMRNDTEINFSLWVMLTNGMTALALNLAVFLLIGKTSALTMNIAGVIKDWLLIGLSYLIFRSPVSALNLFGYLIAFLGVLYYNNQHMKQVKIKFQNLQPIKIVDKQDQEKKPLLNTNVTYQNGTKSKE